MKKLIFIFLFKLLIFKSFAFINIQEITTNNGIKALLYYNPNTPIISITFSFEAGSKYDPIRKNGISSILSQMLSEGAGKFSVKEFAEILRNLSTNLYFNSPSQDFIIGSINTLRTNKEKVFNILEKILTQPNFKNENFERICKQNITSIIFNEKNPNKIVSNEIRKFIFKGHPYSHPTIGTIEGINNIQIKDLEDFFRKRFTKETLIIGASGNITKEELLYFIDKTFKNIPNKASKLLGDKLTLKQKGQSKFITLDIPQSIINFVQEGIYYKDTKEFIRYLILLNILNERLSKKIREKNGLTYCINISSILLKHAPIIKGSISTKKTNVNKAIELIKKEWEKIRENGITIKELQRAKKYFIGSYPLNFVNSKSSSILLHKELLLDKSGNFIQRYKQEIKKINIEQMDKLAKKIIKPKDLTFVIAGK